MSTRSVIARPTPDGGFHGTYCHNDGYPAHQGRILFDAVTGNWHRLATMTIFRMGFRRCGTSPMRPRYAA